MKRTFIILCALLAMQSAQALIVSVKGEGEVPEEGLDLLITEAEEDVLTGQAVMALEGDLLTDAAQITVRITRSANDLQDEFCCGNNCTAGNGQTDEVKTFGIDGLAHWYTHYTPVEGSDVTITYLFDDGEESLELRVHYQYGTDAVEQVNHDAPHNAKRLHDGQVLIEHNGLFYTVTGKMFPGR